MSIPKEQPYNLSTLYYVGNKIGGRCVQKMDHHCPWINNCVGWGNHAHFTYFLLFATLGCMHASIVLGCSLYRALHKNHYLFYNVENVPIVHLGLLGIITTILSLGFAIGVVCAVGTLLVLQLGSVITNRTGIENWIIEKANYRRRDATDKFVFPYDLGRWQNLKQVLTIDGRPVGDGIYWPIREGCTQYTLTIEQLEQKNEKRLKSRMYSAVKPASGYWFPVVHGIKVCLNFPCTDETRLTLSVGDLILVTRWRKHWLFGEKIQTDLPKGQEALLRQRGWFPRRCVIETPDSQQPHIPENNDKKLN